MKVIFVSNYLPEKYLEQHSFFAKTVLSSAIQKMDGLIIKGLIENGIENLSLISYPPISKSNCNESKMNRFERNDNCKIVVVKALNKPILRNVITYKEIKKEIMRQSKNEDVIILLDALNPTSMMATIDAAKKLKIKVIGIITDVNGIRAKITNEKQGLKQFLACKLGFKYQTKCDGYVFLTEQMNSLINIRNKPYCVVEGMCDLGTLEKDKKINKNRVIMYAGSLHKIYGIPLLVKAFIEGKFENAILEIYGEGDYSEELENICKSYKNIIYKGVVNNSQIVKREREVDLLVNPRPTDETFTLYSFPSKTIEYMVSGTPVISSKLPGIPKEYFDYIYSFDEISAEGIKKVLEDVLSLSDEELLSKGKEARSFVINHKNYIKQTKPIADLLRL